MSSLVSLWAAATHAHTPFHVFCLLSSTSPSAFCLYFPRLPLVGSPCNSYGGPKTPPHSCPSPPTPTPTPTPPTSTHFSGRSLAYPPPFGLASRLHSGSWHNAGSSSASSFAPVLFFALVSFPQPHTASLSLSFPVVVVVLFIQSTLILESTILE